MNHGHRWTTYVNIMNKLKNTAVTWCKMVEVMENDGKRWKTMRNHDNHEKSWKLWKFKKSWKYFMIFHDFLNFHNFHDFSWSSWFLIAFHRLSSFSITSTISHHVIDPTSQKSHIFTQSHIYVLTGYNKNKIYFL